MKLRLCVSGKMRKGPEHTLFNKYLVRSKKIGRLINVSSITVLEYDGVKWTRFLTELSSSKSLQSRSYRILLDERGKNHSSDRFAETLKVHRDNGTPEFVFFIGGADGVPANLTNHFDELLAFGSMVWPHFLARIMLMEQIYRASTILAGLPYHKD